MPFGVSLLHIRSKDEAKEYGALGNFEITVYYVAHIRVIALSG